MKGQQIYPAAASVWKERLMKKSVPTYLILVLPGIIVYSVFMFFPLISSFAYSLFDWTGFGPKTFIGFKNFQLLFNGGEYTIRIKNALSNNIKFFIYTMIIQNIPALVIAAILNSISKNKGANFFRTIFFIPVTISVIIVGYLWLLIYNPIWGSINVALKSVGLENMATPWLGEKSTALICVAIANAWQYQGFPMLLFLAGLYGIDSSLVEASKVDGCNSVQTFFYIQLPSIRPVIFVVTVLTFIGNFSGFEIIYAMEGTRAGPAFGTDIMGTLFYRVCFGAATGFRPEMGLGAAIATCMFTIIAVPVIFYYCISQKKNV
jgi:raffinose/stachyose/melibiose transport system permease protein